MSSIPRVALGRTGELVSKLGFGAMELRGGPGFPFVSDVDADRLLNAVIDAGINVIDTSIDYGRSEELIGRFLAHRRDEFLIATKCGCVPGAPPGHEHQNTAANIRFGVEHSLRLLGTDRLDVVQFHGGSTGIGGLRSLTPCELEAEGAVEELISLQTAGKVRFIGVSANLPELDGLIDMQLFDVVQVPYSVLLTDHEAVMSKAAASGVGTIVRGAATGGVPSGWEHRDYHWISGAALRSRWVEAQLDQLSCGQTPMEFSLALTLSHPDVHTAIVGTGSRDHLAANVAIAALGAVSAEVLDEAHRRLAAVGPPLSAR